MRVAILFAAVAGTASAQTGPQVGVVSAPDVIARAAARADAPETLTLYRGTAVSVHHAEGDDWLAIQPPKGSVSWVNHKFIRPVKPGETQYPQSWVVASDAAVKLAAGRAGVNKPLEVRFAQIPDGTILTVTGPKVDNPDDGSKWYPIVPPEDDFRYVPKAAVQIQGAAPTGFIVKSPTAPAAGAKVDAMVPPVAKPSASTNPTWQRAEQADRDNDYDTAERLYFQVAREMNAPGGDADLANLCYSRVHALRERKRGGSTPAPDRTPKAEPVSRPKEERREPREEKKEPEEARAQWTGSGVLRAAFKSNGRQVYALEDDRGKLRYYAIGTMGVELDRYTRQTVDVFGKVTHPADLRGVGLVWAEKVDAGK